VASKWLGRDMTTSAPKVLRRRRKHSTPTPDVEAAGHVTQEVGHERRQGDPQPRMSRRRSLLSRARSLRGVKSLSDLRIGSRRGEKSKGQSGSLYVERSEQAREGLQCVVIRMSSVNSASSAPLYVLTGAE
jgi:hypothetical protein